MSDHRNMLRLDDVGSDLCRRDYPYPVQAGLLDQEILLFLTDSLVEAEIQKLLQLDLELQGIMGIQVEVTYRDLPVNAKEVLSYIPGDGATTSSARLKGWKPSTEPLSPEGLNLLRLLMEQGGKMTIKTEHFEGAEWFGDEDNTDVLRRRQDMGLIDLQEGNDE